MDETQYIATATLQDVGYVVEIAGHHISGVGGQLPVLIGNSGHLHLGIHDRENLTLHDECSTTKPVERNHFTETLAASGGSLCAPPTILYSTERTQQVHVYVHRANS